MSVTDPSPGRCAPSAASASVTTEVEVSVHTAAVRPAVATSGPHQTAHSSTSPCHDVHCASAPDGTEPCGNAGESLAPVAGTCAAKSSTCDHDGEIASSEKTRFVRPLMSATPVT